MTGEIIGSILPSNILHCSTDGLVKTRPICHRVTRLTRRVVQNGYAHRFYPNFCRVESTRAISELTARVFTQRKKDLLSTEMAASFASGDDTEMVAILSIDGGGIRGMIPAVILEAFEQQLQKEEDERKTGHTARIAHYFDAIGGTSTGGLIAAMLAAPVPGQKLPYAAKDIVSFYKERAKYIFKPSGWWPEGWFHADRSLLRTEATGSEALVAEKEVRGIVWPSQKYIGKNIRKEVNSKIGDETISETLTDLVIPTFDVYLEHPIIFSTDEGKKDPSKNAKVADICIGTSAAPTYFPAHSFDVANKSYNLIDGGLAANNPTECVMSYVSKKLKGDGKCFKSNNPIKPNDYSKFLVISLGTGDVQNKPRYTAKEVANWGVLGGWLRLSGPQPLLDFLRDGSTYMVDYAVQSNFDNMDDTVEKYYLRIQTTELNADTAQIDNVEKENLRNLEELGRNLLEEKVKKVNLDTGKLEYIPEDNRTNRDALSFFAKQLVDQRIKKEKAAGKV